MFLRRELAECVIGPHPPLRRVILMQEELCYNMATPEKPYWIDAVDREHNKFLKYRSVMEVSRDEIPADAKIMDMTWAMKRKSNGTFGARCNVRGFKQIDGEHYLEDDKAAPIVNDVTIRTILTLMLMASYDAWVIDVNGAFLNGNFSNNEKIYVKNHALRELIHLIMADENGRITKSET